MEKIYKDLGDNNIKRQKLLQIRHVIENYILQGISPQKAFTTDPKNKRSVRWWMSRYINLR